MGGWLLPLFKTMLTVIVTGALVIAAFYFAYVLLVLVIMGCVGAVAYAFYNRERIKSWLDEDSDFY